MAWLGMGIRGAGERVSWEDADSDPLGDLQQWARALHDREWLPTSIPTVVSIELTTEPPATSDAPSETTGNGYARQRVFWSVPPLGRADAGRPVSVVGLDAGPYDDRPDDCWSCDEQPAMDDFGLCASCKVALR